MDTESIKRKESMIPTSTYKQTTIKNPNLSKRVALTATAAIIKSQHLNHVSQRRPSKRSYPLKEVLPVPKLKSMLKIN